MRQRIYADIPEDVYLRLIEYARVDDRSLAYMVRSAVLELDQRRQDVAAETG